MATDPDIHVASEEEPILTRYEPDFRRAFARGSLLRISENDPETLQIAFWSRKDTGIEMEEGPPATGYYLETEVMMTWSTAQRLHKLLGMYLEEHAPESPTEDTSTDEPESGA